MTLSRRAVLLQGTLAALASSVPITGLCAGTSENSSRSPSVAPPAAPPIVFVHGNGDHASLWLTTLWRFESNGFPTDRLLAFDFTDPLARADNSQEQPQRSSTDDQLRELTTNIESIRQRTGANRVALVANSRGGYAVRSYVQNGGSANVSHVVLCGVPNRGVFNSESGLGNEFNGRGPFLQRLNAGEIDVVDGIAFLTLRSDEYDKYAQPDGRFIGRPGTPTGITHDGPSLRGATNLVLGRLDHREVAFHPRAFREMYKFILGREPERIGILAQERVILNGLVTGFPDAVPTNRPIEGSTVAIYRVSSETGERIGTEIHRRITGPDGGWGPALVDPTWYLEFVVEASGSPITHIYRSPFLRSSSIVHLRPGPALNPKGLSSGAVVVLSRPRGYFGIPRDVVLLDGKEPEDVAKGVPTESKTSIHLSAGEVGRAVIAQFNEERIVCRAWPTKENRITIAELTF